MTISESDSSPRLSQLSRSIAGRRALVTGAASGIGRASARLFADEGARVVLADVGEERVAAAVEEIRAVHGPEAATGVVADVSDPDARRRLVEEATAWLGGLDILVNNAGISSRSQLALDEAEFEDAWTRTMEINLSAQVRLIRLARPHLLDSDAARVVNIASSEAIVTGAGMAAYAASKAGVTGMTRALAVELGPDGINVNAICPGPIRTGMTAPIPEEMKEKYARRRVALRRYGDPEELAHMVLNLSLPAASFITGISVPVDGGMTIRHT
ncbi:SDR family NAD(P)-dependent oxidoreductase [Nocardioides insulae]|uniref:SDR family NAD(P)-dependent oxidoreductase n=1 Tax=Nocardioides insulae TaxID=394734 RepID=UPI0003FA0C2F|nr:SDR family NAD(P)-dependent oxidoreductase [Nocardioides insulae]